MKKPYAVEKKLALRVVFQISRLIDHNMFDKNLSIYQIFLQYYFPISLSKNIPTFMKSKSFMFWKIRHRCYDWIVIWYKFNKSFYCRRIFRQDLLCFEREMLARRTKQLHNNAPTLVYCNPFQVFWQNTP